MAALGELRRRGSHQKRKPSARRLRAPLAALAAIAAIVYVAKRPAPSSPFHRPRTDEEKAQERKKLARHPLFAFKRRTELWERWPDGTLGMVVSAYRDDLAWLRNVEAIGIRTHVYGRPGAEAPDAEHQLPVNRGDEAAAYFRYLADHYDNLPEYVMFVHGHEYAYHAPTSMATTCRLDVPTQVEAMGGFASLNHDKRGRTVRKYADRLMPSYSAQWTKQLGRGWSAAFLARALAELYADAEQPPVSTPTKLAFPASAQFVYQRRRFKSGRAPSTRAPTTSPRRRRPRPAAAARAAATSSSSSTTTSSGARGTSTTASAWTTRAGSSASRPSEKARS